MATAILSKNRGCPACAATGYRGRVAVAEYLRCDDDVRALPKGQGFLTEVRRHAAARGWRTLLEDGFAKALRGVTTVEEVLRVAG